MLPIHPFDSSNTSGHLSIHDLLKAQVQRTPDGIAIAALGRKPLTYSRLLGQIDIIVPTLNEARVGLNDRVALVLPNGPEMAVAFLAIAAGATCAPLNPACRANEFDLYFSDLDAKALIVQAGSDCAAIAVARKRGIPVITLLPMSEAEAGVFTLITEERFHDEYDGFAESTDIALVLHTSGTTSRPKIVQLTQANVCTSAYNSVAALELSSSDRCLNVMPLFHIHGLMVILSSVACGAGVICGLCPDLSDFFRCMEAFHPSWYTASPTIHQLIIAQARWNRNVIDRNPLRFIRSSSSPLRPDIMAELENGFNAPVIESYAMTEASYQISSNPLPPGKRKAGSVGVAAGPEVAIMDNLGNLLPHNTSGEIVIRGPNITRGYANNPDANAACFTSGWFRTGDVGHLDQDGYLFITGRLKEIINKGGEKISPREVDEVIMQHYAVAEVATFAIPHPVLGEDVAAAIVLHTDTSVTDTEIREFASHRLACFKVPRQIVIVDKLPRGATGKLQRTTLAAQLGLASNDVMAARLKTGEYVPPHTPIEEMLVWIWGRVLDLKQVGIEDNFFDLGGHSLLALALIAQVTKTFGKNLRLHSLYQAPTIKKLADLLCDRQPSSPYSSLIPLQPNGSRPAFFWVHGEYSDALLPSYLGADQPIYGLTHQSEDGKPAVYTEVETIAKHYLEEIRTIQSEGPYFLGGYSFGGTVAFEMAQQLRRQGKKIALLFLLDSQFPGIADSPNALPHISLIGEIQRHLANIASLSAQQKLSYFLLRLRNKIEATVNNTKTRIDQYQKRLAIKYYLAMHRLLPVSLRSLYILDVYSQARLKYIPQRYSGRVFYVKSGRMESNYHQLEWNRLMGGGLEVHEIPGDHLDLKKESHVHIWAEKLKGWLRTAQATSGGH